MSLSDYVKKALVGGAVVAALGGSAYGQEMTQEAFNAYLKTSEAQWGAADFAFRHGIKNNNHYHVKWKNKDNKATMTFDFYDLDANGPDKGDKFSVVYEINGSIFKGSNVMDTVQYSNLAGLRSNWDRNAEFIESQHK